MQGLDRYLDVRRSYIETLQKIEDLRKTLPKIAQKAEVESDKLDALWDKYVETADDDAPLWLSDIGSIGEALAELELELELEPDIDETPPKMPDPVQLEKVKRKIWALVNGR
jgi:hypothetical protein